MKDIKGNIILIGIQHSGALYEEVDGQEKIATILDSTSRRLFCNVFPELVKAAKGKKIVFLIEGFRLNMFALIGEGIIKDWSLPTCLPSLDTLLGCDTRPDSIKIQTAVIMSLLEPLYEDGLNGAEKTFEEAFMKPSSLDLGTLDSADAQYVYYWGKLTARHNAAFEKYSMDLARLQEKRGHFVVLICGASHVVKIIAEQERKDIGYVLCISSGMIYPVISGAKFLSAMEKYAYTK